jgi:4-nitrophenyl phosphatase
MNHAAKFIPKEIKLMSDQHSLSTLKAMIIDMDGVLWRGDTALPGFTPFFEILRQRQMPFMLATNNASKTQAQYVQRFARLGVEISPDRVMTSSLATADYLKTQFAPGARIHVLGLDGIRQAVVEAGFELADTDVEAVVVGLDFELTYAKLRTATVLLNQGARFIGTNPDLTFPFEGGIAPGNGAILAALSAATGQKPTVIGKPEPTIFELALKRMDAGAAHTAMVGDRLETDILGGQRAGLKTILVLTGVTRPEELASSDIKPDWVFNNLDELVAMM